MQYLTSWRRIYCSITNSVAAMATGKHVNEMTERKPLKFTGDKYAKTDFTEAERAEMRERHTYFDEHFLETDDLVSAAGLKWVSQVAKGLPALLKGFFVVGSIGGVVAVLKKIGWL